MLVAPHPSDEVGKNCTHQPDLSADGVAVKILLGNSWQLIPSAATKSEIC
jgi:hypothetical protein